MGLTKNIAISLLSTCSLNILCKKRVDEFSPLVRKSIIFGTASSFILMVLSFGNNDFAKKSLCKLAAVTVTQEAINLFLENDLLKPYLIKQIPQDFVFAVSCYSLQCLLRIILAPSTIANPQQALTTQCARGCMHYFITKGFEYAANYCGDSYREYFIESGAYQIISNPLACRFGKQISP